MSKIHNSVRIRLILLLSLAGISGPAIVHAAGSSSLDIIEQANGIYAGHNSISHIRFTIHNPGKKDRSQAFTMLWMAPESGPIEDKTLLFQTFPPSKRDVAFMNWSYHENEDKADESWIYLPELRSIRKITHAKHHHGHHNKDPDDEFSMSVLHRPQLLSRPAKLDTLRRLTDQSIGTRSYVRIERIPRMAMPDYPFSRVINWLEKSPWRISRIDYYDTNGSLALQQTIEWQQIGKAWIWSRVEGEIPGKDTWTRLDIQDARIDTRLRNRDFSKRRMRMGPPKHR